MDTYSDFSQWKWWFSMVMRVYQKVIFSWILVFTTFMQHRGSQRFFKHDQPNQPPQSIAPVQHVSHLPLWRQSNPTFRWCGLTIFRFKADSTSKISQKCWQDTVRFPSSCYFSIHDPLVSPNMVCWIMDYLSMIFQAWNLHSAQGYGRAAQTAIQLNQMWPFF